MLIKVIAHFTELPSKFLITETKLYLISLIRFAVMFAGEEVLLNRFSIGNQLTIFEIIVEFIGTSESNQINRKGRESFLN